MIVEGEDRVAMLMMRSALCGGGSEMGVSSSWWERCRRSGRRGTPAAPGRPITAAERWSGAETTSEVTGTPASQYRAIVESIASTGIRTSVLRMPLVHRGIGHRRNVFDAVVGEHGLNVRAVEQRQADIRIRDIGEGSAGAVQHDLVGAGIRDLITQLLSGTIELTRDRHTVRVFTFETECRGHSQPECRVFLLAQGLGHLVDVHRSAAVGAARELEFRSVGRGDRRGHRSRHSAAGVAGHPNGARAEAERVESLRGADTRRG